EAVRARKTQLPFLVRADDDRHAWADEVSELALQVEARRGSDRESGIGRPRVLGVKRRRGVAIALVANAERRELVSVDCHAARKHVGAEVLRDGDVAKDLVAALALLVVAKPSRPPLARHRCANREQRVRVELNSADRARVTAS